MNELTKILQETANVDHVYAMQYGDCIKFGVSKQLLQRYNNIYTDMILPRMWMIPFEMKNLSLHLKAYCTGDRMTEAWIHKKFKTKNVDFGVGREWFKIDKDVELFINVMNICRLEAISLNDFLLNKKNSQNIGNTARLVWLQQNPGGENEIAMQAWITQKYAKLDARVIINE